MSEKPSARKTIESFAMDGMSSANFQVLSAAKAKLAASASTRADTGARADSASTANLQAIRTPRAQPPVASASAKSATPAKGTSTR